MTFRYTFRRNGSDCWRFVGVRQDRDCFSFPRLAGGLGPLWDGGVGCSSTRGLGCLFLNSVGGAGWGCAGDIGSLCRKSNGSVGCRRAGAIGCSFRDSSGVVESKYAGRSGPFLCFGDSSIRCNGTGGWSMKLIEDCREEGQS